MDIKIYYGDNSELALYEAYNKGYRCDVIVSVGRKKYKLYITTMFRLQQDFEIEYRTAGFYLPEHNLIIVNELTKEEIEKTIENLYKSQYFEGKEMVSEEDSDSQEDKGTVLLS